MRYVVNVLIATILALSTAWGETPTPDSGYWLPNPADVRNIERLIRHMPKPANGDAVADPIAQYARYYTGATLNGRKVIFGIFVSKDPKRYPPGVHIVTRENVPSVAGGMCTQLNLWYDVAEKQVKSFHCYGLG
jgi:hypothetical protein